MPTEPLLHEAIPLRGWGLTPELMAFQKIDEGFFKVGVTIWMLGFGYPVEVISIHEDEGGWVGRDYDGDHFYPLAEVPEMWTNHFRPGMGRNS